LVLNKRRRRFPGLDLIWACDGYNPWRIDAAVGRVPLLRPKIVERRDNKRGFVVSRRLAASVSKLCYGDLLAIGRPDSGGSWIKSPTRRRISGSG